MSNTKIIIPVISLVNTSFTTPFNTPVSTPVSTPVNIHIVETTIIKTPIKKTKKVSFSGVKTYETYSEYEYDRTPSIKPICPNEIYELKLELNELKREMEIHPESKQNTRFYPV